MLKSRIGWGRMAAGSLSGRLPPQVRKMIVRRCLNRLGRKERTAQFGIVLKRTERDTTDQKTAPFPTTTRLSEECLQTALGLYTIRDLHCGNR